MALLVVRADAAIDLLPQVAVPAKHLKVGMRGVADDPTIQPNSLAIPFELLAMFVAIFVNVIDSKKCQFRFKTAFAEGAAKCVIGFDLELLVPFPGHPLLLFLAFDVAPSVVSTPATKEALFEIAAVSALGTVFGRLALGVHLAFPAAVAQCAPVLDRLGSSASWA
jgi:hypothetical protein